MPSFPVCSVKSAHRSKRQGTRRTYTAADTAISALYQLSVFFATQNAFGRECTADKKSSEKIKKCKKGIDKGLTVGYNTVKQREIREKNKRKEREAVPLENRIRHSESLLCP